jgi:hypothetical protein
MKYEQNDFQVTGGLTGRLDNKKATRKPDLTTPEGREASERARTKVNWPASEAMAREVEKSSDPVHLSTPEPELDNVTRSLANGDRWEWVRQQADASWLIGLSDVDFDKIRSERGEDGAPVPPDVGTTMVEGKLKGRLAEWRAGAAALKAQKKAQKKARL